MATGKFVGIDLALKFKPWGAVKLAGNLNKALPLIGFALFKQTCFLSALELEKSLQEIKEAIEKTQECDQEFEKWIKAGKDLIKGEDFIEVEPEEE